MRLRTITTCYEDIKRIDQNTAINKWLLRRLVNEGKISYRKSGNKFLIDLDEVLEYFGMEASDRTKIN